MSEEKLHERLTSAFNKEAFYTNYRRTFSIVKAETYSQKEKCFRLRHEVYCEENGLEDPALQLKGLEKDVYDKNSVHYLLIHNESGNTAGTVRIILPNEDHPQDSFQMQEYCDHPILHDPERIRRFCQISRMCMSPLFRRREGDGKVLPAYTEQEDRQTAGHEGNVVLVRRRIPYAPLGLFQAAFETALQNNITDCLMFVEPEQLLDLNRMGISYSTLGPKVPYHGKTQPIIFNVKNALDNMLLDNPGCWDVVSDMGRVHKMANNLYINDWQDHIMDDLDWDHILGKIN